MFFKKFKEQLSDLEDNIILIRSYTHKVNQEMDDVKNIRESVRWSVDNKVYLERKIEGIIKSQQNTIETLMSALCNKYKHGLFIYSEDGKIPTVIRNGKQITDNLTQSFSIDWTVGEMPNIDITQVAGTWEEDNKSE